MTPTATAHIITHTHWDREWFLTSIYTSGWIAGLIDKLGALVETNPAFQFLLDGQTLVIEDLLAAAPEYEAVVRDLVRDEHLILGPYYCQPDWQLTEGESLVRNLLYGHADVTQLGGTPPKTGWLVDTFGHIAQSPQLHRLFGIDAVFVWRGVPQLTPYFTWLGSDGHTLLTVDLFGGYRNLYGITHAPEIAGTRLAAEISKLRAYYPTPDIPLFDGYDLDDNPEDPVMFYAQNTAVQPSDVTINAATPQSFVDTVKQQVRVLPTLASELNSGKYGATFPGTFSARTYLKIMARDCAHLLYRVCEPLAVMAWTRGRAYHAEDYETWARALLQNAVHDCICGVSIDQVHEKMEYTYCRVFEHATADSTASLATILHNFEPGIYAVSTNPFAYQGWIAEQDRCYHVQAEGVGVWPVTDVLALETPNTPAADFEWQNAHYHARLLPDGSVQIGDAHLGQLIASSEHGDTYSNEIGAPRGAFQFTSAPVIEQAAGSNNAVWCCVRYDCTLAWDDVTITATVRLIFDQGPLVRWQIDLDSRGTDFQVDLVFATAHSGTITAGMPFDAVPRAPVDRDLLPRAVDATLAKVLLGQRELNAVDTFPFHDFVSITAGASTAAIFAQGLHTYRADADGRVAITLRRAVEWLTKANLENRVGDAGPFFYVPDARCERKARHELAVAIGDYAPDTIALHHLNATFQTPPLLVEQHAQPDTAAPCTTWPFLHIDLPLDSLHLQQQHGEQYVLARVHNPTPRTLALPEPVQHTDVWGRRLGTIEAVPPKTITTLALVRQPTITAPTAPHTPALISSPQWRVGANHGMPDRAIIEQLTAQAVQLDQQIAALDVELAQASGRERYLLEHRYYVLKRERYEYLLSARLNELKHAAAGQLSEDYLYTPDPAVAEIGFQLNQLRIKRRIFDYIVESI